MKLTTAAILLGSFVLVSCDAQPKKDDAGTTDIAVLLAPSGRGDKSYNDAAFEGVTAAQKQGKLKVSEIGGLRSEDAEAAIDRVAPTSDLIVAVGFQYADAVKAAANRHPNTRFLLLDGEAAGLANVRYVTFRADQGSFLAGVAAGAVSQSRKVAFLGGMQIPIIENFQCGFSRGAAWAGDQRRSPVETVSGFIGNTPSAFSDPAKGKQMAAGMLRRGADVIYHAAGGSGNGAIDAARAEGKKAIGVDTDQGELARGTVLTSMRKRLDVAVARSIADVRANRFAGGQLEMNVANGGVDLVLPGLLPPDAVALVEQARGGIISNAIPVCDG